MEKIFDKKVIYITGASAGIGYATAQLCLEKGATVVITGRNKENLENARKKLLKISSTVIAHNVDVSNESEGSIALFPVLYLHLQQRELFQPKK